jgi:porphobilinogen synthase
MGTVACWTSFGRVDNDATLERYAEMAQVQADAGAHVVGPSGMMDGQIGVVRDALDQIGREDVAILAYTVKYASAFFGPFREAVGSSLKGTARRTSRTRPTHGSPCGSWRSTWRRGPTW